MEKFSQDLAEAIETYLSERFGERVEGAGFELEDFIPSIVDQIEEHLSELEDLIDEAVNVELGDTETDEG